MKKLAYRENERNASFTLNNFNFTNEKKLYSKCGPSLYNSKNNYTLTRPGLYYISILNVFFLSSNVIF